MAMAVDKKSAIYWVIFLVVALYSAISLASFARVIEAEQDAILKNFGTINNVEESPLTINEESMKKALIKTTEGDIELELFSEDMPITVGNFIKLAESDFYDNTKFHRVISGFMIQGGDPNTKEGNVSTYGTGGPGYTIEDEFVEGRSNVRGTISMANTGAPNSGGSQFFINLVDNTNLDFDKPPFTSKHPVFGRVIGGMDIVDMLGKTETNERDIPLEPITILDIVITEV